MDTRFEYDISNMEFYTFDASNETVATCREQRVNVCWINENTDCYRCVFYKRFREE